MTGKGLFMVPWIRDEKGRDVARVKYVGGLIVFCGERSLSALDILCWARPVLYVCFLGSSDEIFSVYEVSRCGAYIDLNIT